MDNQSQLLRINTSILKELDVIDKIIEEKSKYVSPKHFDLSEDEMNRIKDSLQQGHQYRTENDIKLIENFISQTQFYQDFEKQLDNTGLNDLMRHIGFEEMQDDETIFEYGSPGKKFYIILEGVVKVFVPTKSQFKFNKPQLFDFLLEHRNEIIWKQTSNGFELKQWVESMVPSTLPRDSIEVEALKKSMREDPNTSEYKIYPISLYKNVQELEAGDSFGELALSTSKLRAASCVAKGHTSLMTLTKQDYEKILGRKFKRDLHEKVKFFKQFRILRAFSDTQIQRLFYYLKEIKVKRGRIMFKLGDQADGIYFIQKGSFEVSKQINVVQEAKQFLKMGSDGGFNLHTRRELIRVSQIKQDSSLNTLKIALLGSGEVFGLEECQIEESLPRQTQVICTENDSIVYFLPIQDFKEKVLLERGFESVQIESQIKNEFYQTRKEEMKFIRHKRFVDQVEMHNGMRSSKKYNPSQLEATTSNSKKVIDHEEDMTNFNLSVPQGHSYKDKIQGAIQDSQKELLKQKVADLKNMALSPNTTKKQESSHSRHRNAPQSTTQTLDPLSTHDQAKFPISAINIRQQSSSQFSNKQLQIAFLMNHQQQSSTKSPLVQKAKTKYHLQPQQKNITEVPSFSSIQFQIQKQQKQQLHNGQSPHDNHNKVGYSGQRAKYSSQLDDYSRKTSQKSLLNVNKSQQYYQLDRSVGRQQEGSSMLNTKEQLNRATAQTIKNNLNELYSYQNQQFQSKYSKQQQMSKNSLMLMNSKKYSSQEPYIQNQMNEEDITNFQEAQKLSTTQEDLSQQLQYQKSMKLGSTKNSIFQQNQQNTVSQRSSINERLHHKQGQLAQNARITMGSLNIKNQLSRQKYHQDRHTMQQQTMSVEDHLPLNHDNIVDKVQNVRNVTQPNFNQKLANYNSIHQQPNSMVTPIHQSNSYELTNVQRRTIDYETNEDFQDYMPSQRDHQLQENNAKVSQKGKLNENDVNQEFHQLTLDQIKEFYESQLQKQGLKAASKHYNKPGFKLNQKSEFNIKENDSYVENFTSANNHIVYSQVMQEQEGSKTKQQSLTSENSNLKYYYSQYQQQMQLQQNLSQGNSPKKDRNTNQGNDDYCEQYSPEQTSSVKKRQAMEQFQGSSYSSIQESSPSVKYHQMSKQPIHQHQLVTSSDQIHSGNQQIVQETLGQGDSTSLHHNSSLFLQQTSNKKQKSKFPKEQVQGGLNQQSHENSQKLLNNQSSQQLKSFIKPQGISKLELQNKPTSQDVTAVEDTQQTKEQKKQMMVQKDNTTSPFISPLNVNLQKQYILEQQMLRKIQQKVLFKNQSSKPNPPLSPDNHHHVYQLMKNQELYEGLQDPSLLQQDSITRSGYHGILDSEPSPRLSNPSKQQSNQSKQFFMPSTLNPKNKLLMNHIKKKNQKKNKNRLLDERGHQREGSKTSVFQTRKQSKAAQMGNASLGRDSLDSGRDTQQQHPQLIYSQTDHYQKNKHSRNHEVGSHSVGTHYIDNDKNQIKHFLKYDQKIKAKETLINAASGISTLKDDVNRKNKNSYDMDQYQIQDSHFRHNSNSIQNEYKNHILDDHPKSFSSKVSIQQSQLPGIHNKQRLDVIKFRNEMIQKYNDTKKVNAINTSAEQYLNQQLLNMKFKQSETNANILAKNQNKIKLLNKV